MTERFQDTGQGEGLSREELFTRTNGVLVAYAERSMPILYGMVRRGEGRQVLGGVPGRPEDEQLAIDAMGENMLVNVAREADLPYNIMGEHNHYTPLGQLEEEFRGRPHVVLPIDAFDNTSQYKRGLDTPPYTVVGAYHSSDGEPIGAIVGDIKNKIVYFTSGKGVFTRDLENGVTTEIFKSTRTSLKDDNATLATYLGSNEYSLPFFNTFRKLVEEMPPKAVLYPGGGAYIYALLASGAVDAYVMFDEPRTEIDPGLPLALTAGCTAVSVNPDGSFEEYRFNERRTHSDEVPLFIAAATPEVRDEIIRYYMASQSAS